MVTHVAVSVFILAAVLGIPLPGSAAEPPAVRAAEMLAAAHGGTAADYSLVHETNAPETSATWSGKLVDQRTGILHTAYLTDSGTAVEDPPPRSDQGAIQSENSLTAKGDSELVSAVAAVPDDASLPVAIWFDVDVSRAEGVVEDRHPEIEWIADRPVTSTLEQARAIRAELWTARRDAYLAAAEPIIREVTTAGGTVAYTSTSAPVLFADVPAGAVGAVAGIPDIQSLGLEGGWEEQMSSAGRTVRADWAVGPADTGAGVRVGVVEYHNVRNTGDMAGRVVRSYSTTGRLAYGTGAADHPTWVAGAIAGGSASYPGVAPGASIVSASTGGYSASLATDRAIVAAADWAVSPNGGDADIVNASIGQDTAQGAEEGRRYFDSIGWEDGRLVVAASGNYVTFGNWDVVSPATGYNVLTVGGINDRNTASWGDDRVWFVPGSNGSSYRDRTGAAWNSHGDFNKPNLSAPAVSVRTANGMIGDGTSVASPIVAGIAAQIMARAPTLASWPEAMRAILMASAVRRTPMPDGSFSADHEGVGTADATWASRIIANADRGGYRFGGMSAGQTPTYDIPVLPGQRVRAVVAWSSHTSGSNTAKSDALHADLDLRLVGPDGAVRWGATFDNSYEVVEMVAGRSGTVRLEIRSTRFEASSEPYGIAWVVSGPFTDAEESVFRGDIMWALEAGVTAGCAPSRFCPDASVTREQMASFLRRADRLPPSSTDYFGDDERSQHEGDINAVARAGITAGCAARRYCPSSPVTREQMASFLVRALKLPAATRDYFDDDSGSPHQANINALAAAGITGGCAADRFCPRQTVTRGQMAAFLHRGFGR